MDPMLESFISESRDNLETAGQCFLALEQEPDNEDLLNDLFRSMHTIKGSSGLFDIPALTRVVHAAEDVLDSVRSGELEMTSDHIDLFLDAMDQVNAWLDDLESQQSLSDGAEIRGQTLSQALRELLGSNPMPEDVASGSASADKATQGAGTGSTSEPPGWLNSVPDAVRLNSYQRLRSEEQALFAVTYQPDTQCFFSGDDPLHTMRTLPGLLWMQVNNVKPWPDPVELDPYQCNLVFDVLALGPENAIRHHLRYIDDQVKIQPVNGEHLVFPEGEISDQEPFLAFLEAAKPLIEQQLWEELHRHIAPLVEICGETLFQTSVLRWMRALLEDEKVNAAMITALLEALDKGEYHFSPVEYSAADSVNTEQPVDEAPKETATSTDLTRYQNEVLKTQHYILSLPCSPEQLPGRIESVGTVLRNILKATAQPADGLGDAIISALETKTPQPLLQYLNQRVEGSDQSSAPQGVTSEAPEASRDASGLHAERRANTTDTNTTVQQNRTLKVDQQRLDSLMDLVGELVVAKNALPFLARSAENEYGVRALAKEIKAQYAVINRLSEEFQSAMMQIRMIPISTVFQRFPRLVRDLSRKLNKQVRLVLEGEDTEADKNVVESLSDPLIHLVRNSLDHGLDTPEEREAAGKPSDGTIILRAIPYDDQVVIEVVDDGRGIDPEVIKRKAYEKGVVNEEQLDTLTDHEALQLIFAAGFSTAENVSDLSGRGVGMDVVRSVVRQAGGNVVAESVKGKGTTIRLSLPLSMAVTRVMMVEAAGQCYGIAMENISETVRLPKGEIRRIKQQEAIVLRDRLIPVFHLRRLLRLEESPLADEVAILVMRVEQEPVAIVLDAFHEGIDIIQKPLEGVMANYPCYSGASLLGDGRVLLVLKIEELLSCR